MLYFNEGSIVSDVICGSDGYLFLYGGKQEQFFFLLGERKPSVESIDNFKSNIKSRYDFFCERGIKYKHVVFPSKPLVKKKYLPLCYQSVRSLYEEHYYQDDDIFNNVVIYPKEFLVNLETEGITTFRRLDTHNSDVGKFFLTSLLLKAIGIEAVNMCKYTCKNIGGDLSKMVGFPGKSEEEVAQLCLGCYYEIGNRKYLNGNTNEALISFFVGQSNKKRLLIFGDSFFKDLIPFIRPYFSDVMYIRSVNIHKDIVDLYCPDVVFTGNAERYLSNVNSDNFSRNFLLDLYGDVSYQPSKEYIDAFKAQLSYKTYSHLYKGYINKILKNYKNLSVIDIHSWNEQISLISDRGIFHFESTGSDPNIYFQEIIFDSNFSYKFSISIFSSVDSMLQLFYTTIFDSSYSERKSHKVNVVAGENDIEVVLSAKNLGRKLRLDPISKVGEVVIHCMELHAFKDSL